MLVSPHGRAASGDVRVSPRAGVLERWNPGPADLTTGSHPAYAGWTPAWFTTYDPLRDKSYQLTRLGPSIVAFLAWCELGQLAPRTLDQYERDLARGALMYPKVGLEEWTDEHMAHVAKTFKRGEMRSRVAAWKSFFNWAVRTRKVLAKPTDALPTIKRRPKQVYDIFTGAEVAMLTGLPIRDGALFELMFGSGARKGDCMNFRYRDWLPEATAVAPYGMLVFRKGKGGSDRQVPATEMVARKLAELSVLEGVGPNDYLWYTRPGGGTVIDRTGCGPTSFHVWWDRCIVEAAVRPRNPHMTRHTFATAYLRNRGRLETLSLLLGHKSIQTTFDEYGHLDMRDAAVDLGLIQEITF